MGVTWLIILAFYCVTTSDGYFYSQLKSTTPKAFRRYLVATGAPTINLSKLQWGLLSVKGEDRIKVLDISTYFIW
jgi:hypothetical protein